MSFQPPGMVNSQFQGSGGPGGMGMGGGMVPGSAPVNLPPRYPSQLEAGQPTSSAGGGGPMATNNGSLGGPTSSMQQQSSTLNNLQMLPTTSMNQGRSVFVTCRLYNIYLKPCLTKISNTYRFQVT